MISSEEMADPWPTLDWQALPTETLSDGMFIRGVQLSKSIAPCSGVSGRRNRAARRHCCRIPFRSYGRWWWRIPYTLLIVLG